MEAGAKAILRTLSTIQDSSLDLVEGHRPYSFLLCTVRTSFQEIIPAGDANGLTISSASLVIGLYYYTRYSTSLYLQPRDLPS